MSQVKTIILLAALAAMTAWTCNAKTININATEIKGDFTMKLRELLSKATNNDSVFLTFGKGEFVIDGTVQCKGSITIKGAGSAQTTIVLDRGKDRTAGRAFLDDTFIKCYGTIEHPISVAMSDLTIKTKQHSGIWDDAERFAVKIYHANHVDIHNVESYLDNAKLTNFDIRVCSNVTVRDCVISNYNNCKTGGNVWLRGEMHNINICRNKIYKYGNDEAVAFFSKLTDANNNTKGKITRTNIKVTDNEFYYQHNAKTADGLFNDMLFSILTSKDDNNNRCDIRGFELARNRFVTSDLCKRVLYFQFNEVDRHQDFVIHDNEFISNKVNSTETFYRMDIDVNDQSAKQDTIVISNNTMTNNYAIMNPYNGSGYTFLLVRGGNVLLDGNKITNNVTTGPNGQSYGINLLWSGEEGGAVTLRSNVCKGLARIATLESGKGIREFSLTAVNNYFQGRTTLYCKKIDRLDLDFRNNTFDSSHNTFFLQNFASLGNVVFNNNKVNVAPGSGKLMVDDGSNASGTKRFETLEVKGNEFHGIQGQQEMTKHITNVRKRTIKSNSFAR